MKNFFIFFSLLIISIQSYCQLVPVRNNNELVIRNKVKTCSSYYQDLETNETHLIQKLEYDENGVLINEYLLYLWDAISYSYSSNYQYNDGGKVVELLKMQEILNIFPKDADYIDSFGDEPVNENVFFSYNGDGQLVKKEIFVFHSDVLSNTDSANQCIIYEYNNDQLILEQSSSPETRVFNYNYSIKYDYDSMGNLIRKIREFGIEKPLQQETRFKYDSAGHVIEKYVIDPSAPHNNLHERYEYDTYGRLSKLYEYSREEAEFLLETTYQYNKQGQMISGDRGRYVISASAISGPAAAAVSASSRKPASPRFVTEQTASQAWENQHVSIARVWRLCQSTIPKNVADLRWEFPRPSIRLRWCARPSAEM